MSLKIIRNLLQTKLITVSNPLQTAWENSRYKPVDGTAWQKINLLPLEPENPTFGTTALIFESGIFQVTLFFPEFAGPNDAIDRAILIKDLFSRGLTLASGAVTVKIYKTPAISPAMHNDGWYVLPVSIFYYSYIEG